MLCCVVENFKRNSIVYINGVHRHFGQIFVGPCYNALLIKNPIITVELRLKALITVPNERYALVF
jgi:hypothetical protein